VQDTTLLLDQRRQPTLAHVQNIVAWQPGIAAGGRAVLVLAHYDSQPHAPGAGDDGAGVAAMLETIRALRAGPPLLHDVVWLFTDGEETGLLGAQAYAADTARLRRQVGVALNFEGRGNAGPSLTFEVSAHNGWLMREYAQAVPMPLASSLFYEVYRYLPNNTDFTPLREAGVAGLNFAFAGGFSYYHSPADTPAHLSLASVQHHGSYMLSLVRHFARQPLAATQEADYTFFSVPGLGLLRYSATWSLPLVGAATLLLLLVAALAQQQRRLAWGALLGGALGWLGGLGLVVAVGWGLLAAVRALYPQYQAFYEGTFYNGLAYWVALLALALAAWSWYYGQLSRWLRPDSLVGGALLVVLVLAAALAWAAPTSAYVLTWPLLAGTLAWGLSQLRRPGPAGQARASWLDWLLSIPVVLLLVPITALMLVIFGLGDLVLVAVLTLVLGLGLLLPLLLPVLQQPGRMRPAATGRPTRRPCYSLPLWGLAIAVGALGWGQLTSQPTAEHPQQTHLYYYLDAPARRAYWLSALPQLDDWTQPLFAGAPAGPAPRHLPGRPTHWRPAPPLPLATPQAFVLADTSLGTQRRLTLRLLPGQAASTSLLLRLPDTAAATLPLAVRVAGQVVPPRALAQAGLLLLPPAPGGTTLELVLHPRAQLRLRLLSCALGLPPAAGAPALPATFVPAPDFSSFTTQVAQEITLLPAPGPVPSTTLPQLSVAPNKGPRVLVLPATRLGGAVPVRPRVPAALPRPGARPAPARGLGQPKATPHPGAGLPQTQTPTAKRTL
jgi:hypothetical protein